MSTSSLRKFTRGIDAGITGCEVSVRPSRYQKLHHFQFPIRDCDVKRIQSFAITHPITRELVNNLSWNWSNKWHVLVFAKENGTYLCQLHIWYSRQWGLCFHTGQLAPDMPPCLHSLKSPLFPKVALQRLRRGPWELPPEALSHPHLNPHRTHEDFIRSWPLAICHPRVFGKLS